MSIFSPEQISQALFEIDPFETGCKESGRCDQYDSAAQGAYAQLLQGLNPKEALVFELVEWFFAHENINTDCLDPVVAYLYQKKESLKTEVVSRAASMMPQDILSAMGYRKPSQANYERLQAVLNSKELGLDEAGFDFQYTSEEFLHGLCAALGMDMVKVGPQIQCIKSNLDQEREAFKPYLWIDTAFKRQNQPLYALAALEHQRYVWFPQGFWRGALDEQLSFAQCRVREHVYETGGLLGIWGPIKQYWFYYKNDAAYLLARNGELLGEHSMSTKSSQPELLT